MNKIVLKAVGDVTLRWNSLATPLAHVADILAKKDILFCNLETALSTEGSPAEKSVVLSAKPESIEFIVNTGFDVVNIANNHTFDLGVTGFCETLNVLSKNNVCSVGGGNAQYPISSCIVSKNNLRIGFLGYNAYPVKDSLTGSFINGIDQSSIFKDIKRLKNQCDVVVISLHWGIENVFYPSPDQIKMTRAIIDNGASLILGHHPHVVQGIERYKNGLIAYSLGNFQFPAKNVDRLRRTIILSVDISASGVNEFEIVPVLIDDNYLPHPLTGQAKQEMLDHIERISKVIHEPIFTNESWFDAIAYEHLSDNLQSWKIRINKYGLKHLAQCIRWHMSPFVIRCYWSVIKARLHPK